MHTHTHKVGFDETYSAWPLSAPLFHEAVYKLEIDRYILFLGVASRHLAMHRLN